MLAASLSPTTWFPFGGGPRCLGATFAIVEMRVVLREILRRIELDTDTAADERQNLKHVIFVPHRGGRVNESTSRKESQRWSRHVPKRRSTSRCRRLEACRFRERWARDRGDVRARISDIRRGGSNFHCGR
jgi:Cytochrome P450